MRATFVVLLTLGILMDSVCAKVRVRITNVKPAGIRVANTGAKTSNSILINSNRRSSGGIQGKNAEGNSANRGVQSNGKRVTSSGLLTGGRVVVGQLRRLSGVNKHNMAAALATAFAGHSKRRMQYGPGIQMYGRYYNYYPYPIRITHRQCQYISAPNSDLQSNATLTDIIYFQCRMTEVCCDYDCCEETTADAS